MKNDFIDKNSFSSLNLEFFKTELELLSEPGIIFDKNFQPFKTNQKKQLEDYYKKIRSLSQNITKNKSLKSKLNNNLVHIENITSIIKKSTNTECLELTELFSVKKYLYFYERIRKALNKTSFTEHFEMNDFSDLLAFLSLGQHDTPSFHLSDKFSNELKKNRNEIIELKSKLKREHLKAMEKARLELNLQSIEEEFIVSRKSKDKIEKIMTSKWFRLESENFANLNFHFRDPDSIFAIKESIRKKSKEIQKVEKKARTQITEKIFENADNLETSVRKIGMLDFLFIRAKFMEKNQCIIPKISDSRKIDITNSVNLPLKKELHNLNLSYQALDIELSKKINIFTGANMAGKTTILKTVGQFVYLTANAVPLPCSSANIPLVDFIFFIGPDSETKRMDLSSFANEVVSLNKQLEKTDGLFLIDEFARGTNPEEGKAFTLAVLENFLAKEDIILTATHFDFKIDSSMVEHYQINGINPEEMENLRKDQTAILENRLKHLHKYIDYSFHKVDVDETPPRAALTIAKALGINPKIIKRAKKLLLQK